MSRTHRALNNWIVLATVMVVARYSNTSQAAPPVVPERALRIHGPFTVGAADLNPANGGAPTSPNAPRPSGGGTHHHPDDGTGEPPGPQTPPATSAFVDVAGLGGIDPGIAAGDRYVLVCDNATGLAFYDKTGKLLGPKSPGSPFANPFSVFSLFSQVKADIDPQLNYPPGLPPGFNVAHGNGISAYGDVRVMFDPYRKRFWIYAMAKNEIPTDSPSVIKFPAIKMARRDKAAVAVSLTEDPRDGFLTYWWNNTVHNGESNVPAGGPDPVFKTSGEGADYPSLGISPKYFLATIGVNRRDPTFQTKTDKQVKAWLACQTTFVADGQTFDYCGPFYIHMMVVDAEALVGACKGGKPGKPCADGRSFGLFVNARNFVTDRTDSGDFYTNMARGVKPVVMHGLPPTDHATDAYFANNFIERGGDPATKAKLADLKAKVKDLQRQIADAPPARAADLSAKILEKDVEILKLEKELGPKYYVVLWSLEGNSLTPAAYPIRPFAIDGYNDWKFVLNACFRKGNLYAAFQDCFHDPDGNCLQAIRAIRVNTLSGKTEVDRTFGLNNPIDDKPTDRFSYEFPAIEANKHGDMVLVYARSSATLKRSQEVRFSVWYHNESDIRPSRLLHAGEAPYSATEFGRGTDTAGISVDPSDDESIWIAQIFAAKEGSGNGTNRIAFGKVFGMP